MANVLAWKRFVELGQPTYYSQAYKIVFFEGKWHWMRITKTGDVIWRTFRFLKDAFRAADNHFEGRA